MSSENPLNGEPSDEELAPPAPTNASRYYSREHGIAKPTEVNDYYRDFVPDLMEDLKEILDPETAEEAVTAAKVYGEHEINGPECKGHLCEEHKIKPVKTLPPVEEYLARFNPKAMCLKCGKQEADTSYCQGPTGWFSRKCSHGHREEHQTRTCNRCNFQWIESCLEGGASGDVTLKADIRRDLGEMVKSLSITDKDLNDPNFDLERRLDYVRNLAIVLGGYINLL